MSFTVTSIFGMLNPKKYVVLLRHEIVLVCDMKGVLLCKARLVRFKKYIQVLDTQAYLI